MSDRARIEKFPKLSQAEQLSLYSKGVSEVRRYRQGLKTLAEGLKNTRATNPSKVEWALSTVLCLLDGTLVPSDDGCVHVCAGCGEVTGCVACQTCWEAHATLKEHVAETCPTWYDGCHCTVATLLHNIGRADQAEARLKQALVEPLKAYRPDWEPPPDPALEEEPRGP